MESIVVFDLYWIFHHWIKRYNWQIEVIQNKNLTWSLFRFWEKKWICTQRSKYAQNNPLAVFKIVLRSPLELSGTCGSKILIENIYFNNSKLFFHSTSSLPNNQNSSFEGCFCFTKLWWHCHFNLHEDNGNVIIIIQRENWIKNLKSWRNSSCQMSTQFALVKNSAKAIRKVSGIYFIQIFFKKITTQTIDINRYAILYCGKKLST